MEPGLHPRSPVPPGRRAVVPETPPAVLVAACRVGEPLPQSARRRTGGTLSLLLFFVLAPFSLAALIEQVVDAPAGRHHQLGHLVVFDLLEADDGLAHEQALGLARRGLEEPHPQADGVEGGRNVRPLGALPKKDSRFVRFLQGVGSEPFSSGGAVLPERAQGPARLSTHQIHHRKKFRASFVAANRMHGLQPPGASPKVHQFSKAAEPPRGAHVPC
mmetsp:Transcript_38314/g.85533  ORF Transcript_38314/g.85533 Transcript_38314/m.85533 type:complete len:217 (-) Transcript_38314:1162-1812(-)